MEKRRMRSVLRRNAKGSRRTILTLVALAVVASVSVHSYADEPYARHRDYDLQHSKIALRFDVEQKKVIGDVTHTLVILHGGISKIKFDSVGLTIQTVTLNKPTVKFSNTGTKLIVPLPAAARSGDKFEIGRAHV